MFLESFYKKLKTYAHIHQPEYTTTRLVYIDCHFDLLSHISSFPLTQILIRTFSGYVLLPNTVWDFGDP
jgi:hypothetical protein